MAGPGQSDGHVAAVIEHFVRVIALDDDHRTATRTNLERIAEPMSKRSWPTGILPALEEGRGRDQPSAEAKKGLSALRGIPSAIEVLTVVFAGQLAPLVAKCPPLFIELP